MSEEHDRELFEQAFRPPGAEPYDLTQPFDPEKLMDGFTVEERVIHAEPGTPLGEMAERACEAWEAFLAGDETP